MEELRHAVRNVDNMRLEWEQKMMEFHSALQDLEHMQKRDRRTISFSLECIKRMQQRDGGLAGFQGQSSIELGLPVGQPFPQPIPCPATSPYFQVSGLVPSPYSADEPLYPLLYIIDKVILSAPN